VCHEIRIDSLSYRDKNMRGRLGRLMTSFLLVLSKASLVIQHRDHACVQCTVGQQTVVYT